MQRTVEIISVTPEMAKGFLEKNHANRNLRQNKVQQYTKDMMSGEWNILTQISFDRDGNLLDGQHRLASVVKSGETIEFIVVRGEDSDSIGYDRGSLRSLSDSMVMSGMNKTLAQKRTVATIRYILIEAFGLNTVTDRMVINYAEKYQDELINSSAISGKGSNHALCYKASIIASIFFAMRSGVSKDVLERFCVVVNSGMSTSDGETSAVLLRNYIMSNVMRGKENRKTAASVAEQAIRDFSRNIPRRRQYNADIFVYQNNIHKEDEYFLKQI